MASKRAMASALSATPSRALPTLCSISSPVCRAASALRSASARTSSATTAKPRPASPARAASTAALRASRLVWKAISSIVFTIRAVDSAEVWMRPIASARRAMPPRPWSAVSCAVDVRVRASCPWRALCCA
jgi:hypothetical protein